MIAVSREDSVFSQSPVIYALQYMYLRNPEIGTPETIIIIVLTIERVRLSAQYCVYKMQVELQ